MLKAEIQAAIAEVRAIYAELERRPAARGCQARAECCRFEITGLTPQLTRGEALLAAKAFRASGRKALPEPEDGTCPLLDPATARCRIYDARPFGCRTHFCDAAGGPYPRKMVLDLIRRLEAVDLRLGGEVLALIKASWVFLAAPEAARHIAISNRLYGKVASIKHGAVNSEVLLALPGGGTVCAMLESASLSGMALEVGADACALISPAHIILASLA